MTGHDLFMSIHFPLWSSHPAARATIVFQYRLPPVSLPISVYCLSIRLRLHLIIFFSPLYPDLTYS